jgi:hypothetical protein
MHAMADGTGRGWGRVEMESGDGGIGNLGFVGRSWARLPVCRSFYWWASYVRKFLY